MALKATLLCIDDYEPSLASRREYFEACNFEVLTATDGAKGLQVLEQKPVDLVILDYSMPGLSGPETASAIRREHPQLPIVMVSGLPAETMDLPTGLVDATYVKGQRMSELRKMVEALIARPAPSPLARVNQDGYNKSSS